MLHGTVTVYGASPEIIILRVFKTRLSHDREMWVIKFTNYAGGAFHVSGLNKNESTSE